MKWSVTVLSIEMECSLSVKQGGMVTGGGRQNGTVTGGSGLSGIVTGGSR